MLKRKWNGSTSRRHITPYTEIVYGAHSLAITLSSVLQIRCKVLCAQTWFGSGEWFDRPDAFSLPHANPMEQSPNQLSQKLPILKYTGQREIEILSGVIYTYINPCCQLNVIVWPSLKQTQRYVWLAHPLVTPAARVCAPDQAHY